VIELESEHLIELKCNKITAGIIPSKYQTPIGSLKEKK